MRIRIWLVLLCVFVALGPVVALASAGGSHDDSAQGGHAAGEAKPPLLSFDPGVALWSIIVFVLLLLLLRAVAWKPILQALQQREEFIRDSLDRAKQDREEAERKLKECAARVEKGRGEAEAIIEQARRDAEIARLRIREEAQNDADAMLERAKSEIDLARTSAIREVYQVGAQLATEAAAKILGREVDPAEHERLIAESIEELAGRRS